jgi:hypothetical protein
MTTESTDSLPERLGLRAKPKPKRTPLVGAPPLQPAQADGPVRMEDFYAYMPTANSYLFVPTGDMWPATSVDARVRPVLVPGRDKPLPASKWLDVNRAIEQMTWAPGEGVEIRDRLIADGGWFTRPGCVLLNLYRPPVIVPRAGDVGPWLKHLEYIYPEGSDHAVKWLAHRVQKPAEKPNHALLLGGPQGIGKDSILQPVKEAIGPWNFADVSPQNVLGRFNKFGRSVILRISEARDLGDVDRFAFYDHMKTYTAAPPDVLRIDEKFKGEYYVPNVCGVIITSNHKSDGIFLPADDRRHYVLWSPRTKDNFSPEYWPAFWRWLATGGTAFVAHYLKTLDLSGWDAKAPPPKTQAFYEIVNANRAPEDAEMADVMDKLGRPDVVTLKQIVSRAAGNDFADWLRDRRNRRRIPHRMEECGYVPVRNQMSYGSDLPESYHQAGIYAARILMQPTKFHLALNLKAAKTLGLEVPPALLARADEAIE